MYRELWYKHAWVRVLSRETEKGEWWEGECWEKEADSEGGRGREGGREPRKKGRAEAYLLFLASSFPPPLADAEGAGCSDDILCRTSTSWPLSLRHTRTASSLWGGREKAGRREGGMLSPRRFPWIFFHSHKSLLISIIILCQSLHCKWKRISIYHYSVLIGGAHSGINIKDLHKF